MIYNPRSMSAFIHKYQQSEKGVQTDDQQKCQLCTNQPCTKHFQNTQNNPLILSVSGSMSISKKHGRVGSPGMVLMAPARGQMKPAPTLARTSRIGTTNPVGRPLRVGSCERERWVLAIQMGSLSKPRALYRSSFFCASSKISIPSAPYTLQDRALIFSSRGSSRSQRNRKSLFCCAALFTASARPTAPAPVGKKEA